MVPLNSHSFVKLHLRGVVTSHSHIMVSLHLHSMVTLYLHGVVTYAKCFMQSVLAIESVTPVQFANSLLMGAAAAKG